VILHHIQQLFDFALDFLPFARTGGKQAQLAVDLF
jgi:hypothetical protein